MGNLWMELQAKKLGLAVFHCSDAAMRGRTADGETRRQLIYLIGMAHPHLRFRLQTHKKRGGRGAEKNLAIFARFRTHLSATQKMAHQLHTIANAQNRDALFKKGLIAARRAGVGNRSGTAGEDDALGMIGQNFLQRRIIGQDLAENM